MGNRVIDFMLQLKSNAQQVLGNLSKHAKPAAKDVEGIGKGAKTADKGLDGAAKSSNKLASAVDKAAKSAGGLFRNLVNIKAGFDMAAGAVRLLVSGVKAAFSVVKHAFDMETLEMQFAVLLRSVDKAKAKMSELSDFAVSTPFDLKGVVSASRTLQLFAGDALSGVRGLTLIGDAAAGSGAPLEELSFWIGRLWSSMSAGRPAGRALMRLQELQIITGTTRQAIEDLTQSGGTMRDMWSLVEKDMGRFSGMMAKTEATGNGLVAAIQESWQVSLVDIGGAFMDLAKNELQYVKNKLEELRKSGAIKEWAEKAKAAIQPVAEAFLNLFDSQTRGVTLEVAWDSVKAVWDYALEMMKAGADYLYNKIKAAMATSSDVVENYNNAAERGFRGSAWSADAKFKTRIRGNAKKIAEAAEIRRQNAAEGLGEAQAEMPEEKRIREQNEKAAEDARQAAFDLGDRAKRREDVNAASDDIAKKVNNAKTIERAEKLVLKATQNVQEAYADALKVTAEDADASQRAIVKAVDAETKAIEKLRLLREKEQRSTWLERATEQAKENSQSAIDAAKKQAEKHRDEMVKASRTRFTEGDVTARMREEKNAGAREKAEQKQEKLIEAWRARRAALSRGLGGTLSKRQETALRMADERDAKIQQEKAAMQAAERKAAEMERERKKAVEIAEQQRTHLASIDKKMDDNKDGLSD